MLLEGAGVPAGGVVLLEGTGVVVLVGAEALETGCVLLPLVLLVVFVV